MSKRGTLINKHHTKNSNKTKNNLTDELDWSFSSNHSMNGATDSENTHLYSLISSFEQNTWAGFDLLREKINDQQKSISNIESFCTNFDFDAIHSSNKIQTNENSQRIGSALIDSIEIDTLQQIQNKCENINRNVNSLLTMATAEPPILTTANDQVNGVEHSDNLSNTKNDDHNNDHHHSNGPNARRTAGIPFATPSNDVQGNIHSLNDTNAVRLAGISPTNLYSAGSHFGAGSHNTTEVFTNSLLVNELQNNDGGVIIEDDVDSGEISVQSNSTAVLNTDFQPLINFAATAGSTRRLKHHFHLSRTSINTTTDMIYDHLHKHGISDTSNIKVTKLVPKNRDISTLSFVSFKIDTNHDIAKVISVPNFWPQQCIWKEFVPKPRPVANFAPNISSFLEDCQSPPIRTR